MIDGGVLLASAIVVFALLGALWLVSLAMRDASIVDIAWGPAFVAIAAVSYGVGGGAPARSNLVLALVALWGLRLGGYLAWRNLGRFETVGDLQLARFKAAPQNAGKVLDSGLWAWTRHPNYFGDFLVWWGLFLIALATPRGYLSVAGPAIMSWLLMKVSGVPMLERSLRKKRPAYDDYRLRVPAFFPRPPQRPAASSRSAR